MNLQDLYAASVRHHEVNNQTAQNHHPHPELVEMKPSFWQRISVRRQRDMQFRPAEVRPAQ